VLPADKRMVVPRKLDEGLVDDQVPTSHALSFEKVLCNEVIQHPQRDSESKGALESRS
jgi:hypothetical protein